MFHQAAIAQLKEERMEYYRHQISLEERDKIAERIAVILADAFPHFALQITGKKEMPARNRALLKEWFEHATIAAPFFQYGFLLS